MSENVVEIPKAAEEQPKPAEGPTPEERQTAFKKELHELQEKHGIVVMPFVQIAFNSEGKPVLGGDVLIIPKE